MSRQKAAPEAVQVAAMSDTSGRLRQGTWPPVLCRNVLEGRGEVAVPVTEQELEPASPLAELP